MVYVFMMTRKSAFLNSEPWIAYWMLTLLVNETPPPKEKRNLGTPRAPLNAHLQKLAILICFRLATSRSVRVGIDMEMFASNIFHAATRNPNQAMIGRGMVV